EPLACVPSGAVKYVNAYNGLRMRSAPGLASPLVTFLWNGEYVKVVGCDVWADAILWSQVEVNRYGVKTTGWVSAAFLVTYPGYNEPTDSYTGAGCKVISGPLNLRATAGLKGKIVRTVPYGTILPYTATPDVTVDGIVWQELTLNGSVVYAARPYLECFAVPQD
ncbi:MAG: SH3 domain-containing protein, partial [Chloroflexi bacterium]|nr:SH3 domain-containing protein [Chloroflexota bacterium]